MKKALVVLLLLAVAGGLFAQVTFSGGVYSGFGLYKKGANDLHAGTNSAWNGADGIHVRLNTAFTGADGNYGFNASIRGTGILGSLGSSTTADSGFSANAQISVAYGWMNGFNGFVKGYGGRINTTQIIAVDYNYADHMYGNNLGLQGYVYPIAGLTIGAGVKANDGPTGGAVKIDGLGYWGGVKYVADVFAFAAEVDYLKDSNTRAAVSVDYTGLDILDIDAAARFFHLEDGNARTMRFDEHIGLNLIDNVGIHIVAREEISAVDNADMVLGAGATVDYKGLGKIVPALAVGFIQGAGFSDPGLAGRQWGDATFDADQKFITVNPNVKFSTTDKSYVTLGYTLGYDIGDVAAAGTDADNPMSHAVYLDYVVEF